MSDRFDEKRDRVEGTIDQVKGRGKQGVGEVFDDQQTRTEGQVDEGKGKAQQTVGNLKDKAKDLKDKVSG